MIIRTHIHTTCEQDLLLLVKSQGLHHSGGSFRGVGTDGDALLPQLFRGEGGVGDAAQGALIFPLVQMEPLTRTGRKKGAEAATNRSSWENLLTTGLMDQK